MSVALSPVQSFSIFARWGFFDRMQDGFCKPPNRRTWSFQKIYEEWENMDFFKSLRELGYVKVSYNNGAFADFIPSAENVNRHQAIALSCFMASCYANSSVQMTCPHDREGEFTAVFKRIDDYTVQYTTDFGSIVQFQFDNSRQSQF